MKFLYTLLALLSLTLPFVATEIGFPESAAENPQLFFAGVIAVSVVLFVVFLLLAIRLFKK